MDDFPEYAYVPGGPWPHPNRGGQGGHDPVAAIPEDDWRGSAVYRRAVALFNGGYYWEAHEAWESLWHAHGRKGPTADLLKALIKLAAAGVKVREGQPRGVSTHARRAAELFEAVSRQAGRFRLGLDLEACRDLAHVIADDPPTDPAPRGERVSRVFAWTLDPR